ALLLASRKIVDGINYAKTLVGKGAEVPAIIEKKKGDFGGYEIKGKRLGVIGLGAIGAMVANDALALGMEVEGYDPFISVDAAWSLSREVKKARGLDDLIASCDFISLHVPLTDKTKGMLNAERFGMMKKGVKILNFARGGLVNNADLKKAIQDGIVAAYVTDFADEELLKMDNTICIPHLGASTEESEENCAMMAVHQVMDFLETGNIVNSVNFPACSMGRVRGSRICIANKNVSGVVGHISTILAEGKLNISEMLNKSHGDYAYNIVDIDATVPQEVISKLAAVKDVIKVRLIQKSGK
ncbi:MAG TPA: phosphoglycerate dehydrogenase, partial [bacterium]|nr:phosphoglycerate dehydrogenase [bacterium]